MGSPFESGVDPIGFDISLPFVHWVNLLLLGPFSILNLPFGQFLTLSTVDIWGWVILC